MRGMEPMRSGAIDPEGGGKDGTEMKPVFLIGYMGCGKSTLGRKLARRLGVPFYDTDAMVEQSEGASVGDIFRYEGEARFRELERAAVESILAEGGGCVVSTGGGLPVWGDNMERLNAEGQTFYLRRTAEQIAGRLSPYGRRRRPKLSGLGDDELVAYMTRDMAVREPFYAQARTIIECEGADDEHLVARLVNEIRR